MIARIAQPVFLALLLSALIPAAHAGTYTAASCNQSDVNALINGPTHTAGVGDTVVIPAGTCTWTTGLSISSGITLVGTGTPNTTPNTFGSGTLNTIIVDNAGSSNALIGVIGLPYGQTFHLSLLDIEPESSNTSLVSPIQVAGACTSSGCPFVRIDNIGFGLNVRWTETGNGGQADWLIRTDNVFGVLDHNTIPTGSQVQFFNPNHSAYLGVGTNGDNSWAQPDSFGTVNELYAENNSIYVSLTAADCEIAPAGGAVGGCRYVGRFNQITSSNGVGVFGNHGLETDGRPQGGRQIEVYGNTADCISGSCNILVGYRSGTGFVFGNTLSSAGGAWFNSFGSIAVYRTVFTASGGWAGCGGSSPYDTNDGVVYYSGTNSGSSGVNILTDSSKNFPNLTPTGAPYSVYDVTQGWWAEIASNNSTTITIQGSIPEQNNLFKTGDVYQVLRTTVCADQGGRGQGRLVSSTPPSPASALSQTLDPIYEWDDTASVLGQGNFTTDTGRTIANRDWYTDNSGGKPRQQASPSSPFDGTSGVGWGALINRPPTCATGVAYWATDQGSWNGSNNGFGNGILYQCSTTDTWTVHYTPYTYPHPLTNGTGTTAASPAPPLNLTATPQ